MFRHKYLITGILTAAFLLLMSVSCLAATVGTGEQSYRNQVFKVCGISDLTNLDQPMTRAEFAKILVLCSSQKDLVGTTNTAAASDVPASHPYAKYIRIALSNSWMRNKLGGRFDPDSAVTLTDVSKAAMTMLGYTDSDFGDNVINGRLALFNSLGLNDGSGVSGAYDTLTVQGVINVMYNALKTTVKQSNSILGAAIDLTLSSDGSINATNVLDQSMKGPILIKKYSEIQENLPFKMEEATFYYNGSQTSYYQNLQLLSYTSQLQNCGWLIIYYNEGSKTVWGYGTDTGGNAYHCILGTVNCVYYETDNIASPSAVVINDTQYSLGSSEAKFMFSVNGTIEVGDTVVLICKENTSMSGEEELSSYYGVGVVLYRKKGQK